MIALLYVVLWLVGFAIFCAACAKLLGSTPRE